MNKSVIVTGMVLLGVSSLFAVELHKANNTTVLNQAASWSENAVPTADDTLVWNATVTGTGTNVNVGAGGIAVAGLRVENPGGTIVTGDGAAVISMVGPAGITLNGTANLHLNNGVQTSNGVAQTWNVSTGRLLSFGQGVGFGAGSISMIGAGGVSFFGDLQDRVGRTAALTVDWNGPVGTVGTTAARKKMILTDLGSGESTFNMQAGSLTVNSINDNYGFAIGMKNKEMWNITGGTVAVDAGGAFHVGGAGNYATATADGIVNISDAGTLVANGTLPLYMARPSTGAIATKGTINLNQGGTLETDREFRRIIGSVANRAEIHLDGGTLKVRTSQTNLFNNINLVDVGANTTTVETVGSSRVSARNPLENKTAEAGALKKTGTGVLTVKPNYTGPTTVEAGVLGFETAPAGTVGVASGAGITFLSATDMAAAFTDTAKYTLAAGSKVGLHCFANTTMPTIDTSPFGTVGFVKTGDGTLNVTGTQLANLAANIDVLWGTLQVNTAEPFHPSATVTVSNGGRLDLLGSVSATFPNALVLADTTPALYIYREGKTTTFTNSITLLRNTRITTYAASHTLNFNAPITGTGDLYLTGGGGGITHLNTYNLNSKSTYAGNTVLYNDQGANARFNLGVDDAFPVSTALHLGGNTWSSSQTYAMVNLNGYNQVLVGLVDFTDAAAVRIVTNTSATASTMTISNTMDRAFSGRLGGRINMVKQGSFTQQLLGNGQGHTGTVSVAAGTLELAGTSLQNADISVANNARVLLRAGSSLTGASIAVTNGARIQTAAAGTYTVNRTTLSGNGWTLADTDRGALYFGGNNCTWNGELAIAGTARIGNYSGSTLEKLTGPITGTGTLNIWAGGGGVTHPTIYELSGQSTWKGILRLEASHGSHLTVKLMNGDNRLPEDIAVYFDPTWEPAGTARIFSRLDLMGNNQRMGRIYTRTGDHLDHCRAVINSVAATTSTLTLSPSGGQTAYYEGVIGASGPCTSAGAINVVKAGDGVQIFRKGTPWNWIDSTPGTNIINADVAVNAGAVGFSGTDMLAEGRTVTVGAGGALIAPDKATLEALTNDVRFVFASSSAVGLYDTWDVTAADPNRLFYYSGNVILTADNTTALPNGVAFSGGTVQLSLDGVLADTLLGPTTAPVYLNGTTILNNNNNPILSASRTLTINAGGVAFTAGWSKNLTIHSKFTGVGPFNVNCNSGKVILTNPLNDYMGQTTLGVNWPRASGTSATLQLGASEVIPHGDGKGNLIFDAYATGGAKLDLNGFNERVNGLLATLANAAVTNSSSTLSTFTLSGTEAGCTYAGRFDGALKIVKEGTNTTQTLTGLVAHTGASRYRFAPYKDSGETCVKAGTLVVADSARFQTPGAVVAVEGGGTLRVESDAPFGGASSTVMLYAVATSASPTLDIPSGTTVTVRHFHLGGYFRKAGTYGAPDSGADYEVASLFTGGGLLNVLEQGPQEGTTLMFR